ncbi:MAG TPA: bifunctional methylenetetrahydrofolate dehydrogenase/methenyltetrahydrofolate cyclohydrolase, partial [Candidatus Subteraquimicrobiales bacterium]
GIMALLEYTGVEIAGKEAVIVGRSNLVGKPILQLLLQKNATVTVCHSKTNDLSSHTKGADILVAAVGSPQLINGEMVKEGVTIIDVGVNRVDNKLVGDVDFESVKDKAARITPVPGGVGPMTIAMLMKNVLKAAKQSVS